MNFDGLKEDVLSVLAGGRVEVNTKPFKNDLKEKAKDSQIDIICPRNYYVQSKVLKSIPIEMEKIIKQFNV